MLGQQLVDREQNNCDWSLPPTKQKQTTWCATNTITHIHKFNYRQKLVPVFPEVNFCLHIWKRNTLSWLAEPTTLSKCTNKLWPCDCMWLCDCMWHHSKTVATVHHIGRHVERGLSDHLVEMGVGGGSVRGEVWNDHIIHFVLITSLLSANAACFRPVSLPVSRQHVYTAFSCFSHSLMCILMMTMNSNKTCNHCLLKQIISYYCNQRPSQNLFTLAFFSYFCLLLKYDIKPGFGTSFPTSVCCWNTT